MPSILIAWRGQCPSASGRQQLMKRLTELAIIAHEKFDEPYERYDREITGRIVLHSNVFDDRRVPPSLVRHPTHAELYCLERARLFGIEFRLPTIYGGLRDGNRISFVFLCADDEPEMDGFVVRVHDRAMCGRFDDPEVQAADWLLTAPHIHLRYTFEEWTSALLAWVRVAYMPDLRYSEFDHLHGYSMYEYGFNDAHRDFYFERLKNIQP
jgi:hypothetical protein